MSRIQYLPRPIIIHFVQLVGRNRNVPVPESTDADSQKSLAESQESDHRTDLLFQIKNVKVEDDDEEEEEDEEGEVLEDKGKHLNFDNDRLEKEKEKEMEKRRRKEEGNLEYQQLQQEKTEEFQNREEEESEEGRGQGSARKPSGGIYIATSFTQAKIPGQERLKSSTLVLNDLIGNKIDNIEGVSSANKKDTLNNVVKIENSSSSNIEAKNEFDFFSDDVSFQDINLKTNTNKTEKDTRNLETEFNDLFDVMDFNEIINKIDDKKNEINDEENELFYENSTNKNENEVNEEASV